MSSSHLTISPSEIRLATASLAALALALPTLYLLRNALSPWQKTTDAEPPQLRTFRKYIASYSSLRPAALTASASQNFLHAILPLSLNLPSRTLQPFKQHSAMIFSLFSSFEMIPHPNGSGTSMHFSPSTNTAIAHCKMGGRINGESEKGKLLVKRGVLEWWTECVLFVRFDGVGESVVEVREFVDSAKAGELRLRLEGVLEG
ncbi:hypothetical protein BCR34DRAFT_588680 [Clohesyomyces aquaticus]|uniref:Uncharacterized protein n=1 Tax=Clohesyomyces aquaticus TaxID=1231657 RepID=A0A1Y1ZJB2_9PLEO|nr:hypothetical protein BCR34DRAFT_588680 [Clohesyomyces aquaticus]